MITRRRFLTAMAAAPILTALYVWRLEPTWVEFVHRPLPIRDLPDGLVGKSLVQLSDIHVGPQVDADYLAQVFAAVSALSPDFVVYTGDFITYRGPATLAGFRRMADRLPRGKRGTVAVLGNHDYGDGWAQAAVGNAVARTLAENGCAVLRNEVIHLGGLSIGGVDDLWAGRLRLRPLAGALRSPSLMLCHNPDGCDLPGWDGYQGWILSGHTHGGQCKPPFLPAPLLPVQNRRYTAGAFELSGGRSLYINRGLGHLLRVRFNVRPEVTIFQLARA